MRSDGSEYKVWPKSEIVEISSAESVECIKLNDTLLTDEDKTG